MTGADAIFRDKLINHYNMFGPVPMIKRFKNGKYYIEFAGRGFDTVFATQDEAIERVRAWVRMVRDWK